ncbi:MAG: serine/threonine dehydratase [Puniceicoccaceae bacterium]
METLNHFAILAARRRLADDVHATPILSSKTLNQWLGHEIFFKAEGLQKVGAFKARGALNALRCYREFIGRFPERVIANSSGNHAQAVAWACREHGVPCTVYMPEATSQVKQQGTRHYGAELVLLPTRTAVDATAAREAESDGVFWIPPYNHEWVMAGQGTAAAEALDVLDSVHAVVAPCGGGGLLAGTLVTTRALCPGAQVVGAEPAAASDAFQSRKQGRIIALEQTPNTVADGARTLSVGERTFPFLQRLDEFFMCSEARIAYWTQWLTHLLKLQIEPTAALGMEGAWQWLMRQKQPRRVLVILTGANMDAATRQRVWQQDWLTQPPDSLGGGQCD